MNAAATRSKPSWILRPRPRPEARLRLFCFPYAGSGATVFRAWPQALPDEIECCAVQPPGRESRLAEPACRSVSALAERAAEGLLPYLDRPFALFGHSLGALVCFELARLLRHEHGLLPAHLFVSACRAPQRPDPHPALHGLPDARFVEEVQRRYDAIPVAVAGHAELLELLLPTIKADFEAFETYRYASAAPLECPVSSFGGAADPWATREELADWREQTESFFRMKLYPGGHFYLQAAEAELLSELAADLTGAPGRSAAP
jgi:medium-chain acyl-[acyl-carrier-protein] hydrolase